MHGKWFPALPERIFVSRNETFSHLGIKAEMLLHWEDERFPGAGGCYIRALIKRRLTGSPDYPR